MSVYYNENDRFAAAWLRELIAAGAIAKGEVDERSIKDVKPEDVRGFTQCHWFAGIGVWSYALRRAGWGDERPVWTGSCPCQPFSAAGQGKGFDDPRHLWPEWFRLIKECRPTVIFGEQVASAVGGRVKTNEDLYQVLGRKTCFDVLLQSQRLLQKCLPRMREHSTQQTEKCAICGRAYTGTREDFDGSGEVSSEQNRAVVQSGSGGNSETNFSGLLRTDGDRVRLDETEGMEFSVFASDDSSGRLHNREHKSHHLCFECYVSQLGDADDSEGSGLPAESYEASIQRLIAETGRDLEKESSGSWLSLVQSDLERSDYSFGASVISAAGVGAPHIRQRLYFVAKSLRESGERGTGSISRTEAQSRGEGFTDGRFSDGPPDGRKVVGVAHSPDSRRTQTGQHGSGPSSLPARHEQRGGDGELADAESQLDGCGNAGTRGRIEFADGGDLGNSLLPRLEGHGGDGNGSNEPRWLDSESNRPVAEAGATSKLRPASTSYWSDCSWLPCIDGKLRPTERSFQPMADGIAADLGYIRDGDSYVLSPLIGKGSRHRVGRLRGYGNAIVASQAEAFIRAYMETLDDDI